MTQSEFFVILPALTLAVAAMVVLLADLFIPDDRKHLNGWLTLVGFGSALLVLSIYALRRVSGA